MENPRYHFAARIKVARFSSSFSRTMDEWSLGGIDEKLGGIHVYSVSVPAIWTAGRSAHSK